MPEEANGEYRYPWEKIVEFHKEIVRRGQVDFYALQTERDTESSRWGYIANFDMPNLEGPWIIPRQLITSPPFMRRILSGEITELYIGGPYWIQNRASPLGSGQKTYLHPFFVREVSASIEDDNNSLRLVPVEEDWEISPLVSNLLDSRQIVLSMDIDNVGKRVLEQVAEEMESMKIQPARRMRELIIENIPIMEEYFNANFDRNPFFAHWVLFSPPDSSPVTKYLMDDYENMLEQIRETKRIGGLSLLENPNWSEESDKFLGEVLPIVPLNPSQRKAVEGILKFRPITVVSGPPGCGKSQVVLSLVLNAWTRGIKVLFASNNNQAVDVVKERLDVFEKDITIAVRAGSAKVNRVKESIDGVIKYLSVKDEGSYLSEEEYKRRVSDILNKKKSLEDFLSSKLPEQIEQGLNATFTAYASYTDILATIEKKKDLFQERLKKIGYDISPDDFYRHILFRLEEWFEKASEFIEQWNVEESKKNELEVSIKELEGERVKILESMGINVEEIVQWDYSFEIEIPEELESWLSDFLELLGGGVEKDLEEIEWDDFYDKWHGSKDCHQWLERAFKCVELIRKNCNELEPKLKLVEEQKKELEEKFLEIAEYGFDESWKADLAVLDEWMEMYATVITHEAGRFDWFPFSKIASIRRRMRKKENILKRVFPLSVWRRIGKLNDENRKELSVIVEKTSKYLRTLVRWKDLEKTREFVRKSFHSLRQFVSLLNTVSPPEIDSVSKWREFSEFLELEIERVSLAEQAWLRRERKVFVEKRLGELWDRICNFDRYRLWKLWISSVGKMFYDSLKILVNSPSSEGVRIVKEKLSKVEMVTFIKRWKEVSRLTKKIGEHREKLNDLKGYNYFRDLWVSNAPEDLFIPDNLKEYLPSDGTKTRDIMEELKKWKAEWQDFLKNEKVKLEDKARKEWDWAKENLSKVINLLPDDELKNDLKNQLNDFLNSVSVEWSLEEIRDVFNKYNTRVLKERIKRLNRNLQKLSFEYAKQMWRNRLINNNEVVEALDRLKWHYRKNRNTTIDKKMTGYFSKLLEALPIWVTTAQSPQSIPLIPELFDVVVIDEATQCTLTNLLPLIYRAKRLAVIGDPEQLPAIPVISATAERLLGAKMGVKEYLEVLGHVENDVYRTAVSNLPRKYSDVIQLREHYRSHPLIIGFSNYHIYQQNLLLRREPWKYIPEITGISKVHVEGSASRGRGNSSWLNRKEAEEVAAIVEKLETENLLTQLSVGVVTPFRAHKELIQELLERKKLSRRVTVGTAHSYQGDERDIIIFSPVVSDGMPESTARWVEEPRNLINVAVTRAREGLIVVANFNYLKRQKGLLGSLAKFIEGVELLRKSSKEELELYAWMVLQGMNPIIHPKITDIQPSFLIEQGGINLCVFVREEENQKETNRLIGQGYLVHWVSPRAVKETPAIVLREIISKLEVVHFEVNDESLVAWNTHIN